MKESQLKYIRRKLTDCEDEISELIRIIDEEIKKEQWENKKSTED